mmetsp:Transcript_19539/g.51757  ORF Transcript_19539/g.51757 Transcript_19539/m.51757 type:complete len:271 (-) Transcript_19539:6-818(-)
MEAPNRQGDEVPHRPARRDEVERPRLVHDELELCGVQGVDDDPRVLSAVLCHHLPCGTGCPSGGHLHALGRHVDREVLAAGCGARGVARRPRLGHGELVGAKAQRVVEAPACGGIQLEGPDLAHRDAVEAVVAVRGLGLHNDIGPDVVGRNLVHVGRHPRDLDWQVTHAPLPAALQRHRKPSRCALGGGHQHAGLEEAAALEPEREVVVELAAYAPQEVVLLGTSACSGEQPPGHVLEGVPQPLQGGPIVDDVRDGLEGLHGARSPAAAP